ncbi:gamma-glutamyl-gamma-aminobutyrate hydrolase family protein [Tunicatimonas pelagia]|uniref:gamma-glutamyl-gamma-aminobutyrate hydrolase family protein n=1 Tax=Tunicatimonas pelagia TaxID=931531 RepID=UPI002666B08D|nr:gamma-glutamyl-gamma-aminobutyrate hydrolase family protein [Tunicatimonas pelagia]WKN45902.1 gamma-glutamyl-gamma-aminobutyrate hydrolase family protein [Tunicatimonas pelagia]
MIKLGVTSCLMYPDADRTYFTPKYLCYLERDMARYLYRPNVLPILIPDLAPEDLNNFLAQMDGFVLQGGSDLAPETYGEKPIGRWLGDAYRDEYELKILDYAIKNDKPVFGICRGFQVMNAYLGGTLYQDIATQRPELNQHRDAELYDQLNHPIILEEGKLLARLHQDEDNRIVNTVHHQAVKDLGKDLEVLATSPDGLIEAFQWNQVEEGKVIGVQWHPEFFFNSEVPLMDAERVYTHFLGFCR